jgi:hypothetical protein
MIVIVTLWWPVCATATTSRWRGPNTRSSSGAWLFDAAQTHLSAQLAAASWARVGVLRELGQEALEENGDWVLLHRERPLEVPHWDDGAGRARLQAALLMTGVCAAASTPPSLPTRSKRLFASTGCSA